MTSQLRYNFQATQAVHGADDITTMRFRARSILLAFVVPKLILIFAAEGLLTQPYSINIAATVTVQSKSQNSYPSDFQNTPRSRKKREKETPSDKNPSFGEKKADNASPSKRTKKKKLVAGEAHASDRLLPSSSISSSSSSSILIYIISIKTEWGEKVESSDKILNNQLVTIALPLFFWRL